MLGCAFKYETKAHSVILEMMQRMLKRMGTSAIQTTVRYTQVSREQVKEKLKNDHHYEAGWMLVVEMSDSAELANLMSIEEYLQYIHGR